MVLHGINPKAPEGGLFCIDDWRWRPLCIYVKRVCKDSLGAGEDVLADGCEVDAGKAMRIAIRLTHLIDQCEVAKYSMRFYNEMTWLLDQKCELCDGAGRSSVPESRDPCCVCEGKGTVRPEVYYNFNEGAVRQFVKFLRCSGGFRIGGRILPEVK
jgi:hypothetical protein